MYQVGVDIGGTNIAMGLVDEALEVVQRESMPLSLYTHLRAHETPEHLVCRLLLEKKKSK